MRDQLVAPGAEGHQNGLVRVAEETGYWGVGGGAGGQDYLRVRADGAGKDDARGESMRRRGWGEATSNVKAAWGRTAGESVRFCREERTELLDLRIHDW